MKNVLRFSCLLSLLALSACAGMGADGGNASHSHFDTDRGIAGGNEFSARPDLAPAAKASVEPKEQALQQALRVPLDARLFSAIFGADAQALHPDADQLLRIDSATLLLAEPLRTQVQTGLIACRRAAARCVLAPAQ